MKYLLLILSSIISYTSFSQVLNGSFETDSIPDLSHWEWICGAQSFNNAPSTGGYWSIKVNGGSTQGCLPGYAYQKITSITYGQSFILSGWAYAETSPTVGIYFGKINNGVITTQTGVTTSANSWTQLNIQSSFILATGDTAVVVLNGGLVGGPLQGYGYFDLIDLQQVTGVSSIEQKPASRIFPSPFSTQTTLYFEINLNDANLTVYNSVGQLVKEMRNLSGHTILLQRDNLPCGLYFIKIAQDNKIIATDKFVTTDN